MALAADEVGHAAEHHPHGHEERDRTQWQQEEHRHQDDLRGDREAVPDREPHARENGVGGDEGQGQRQVEPTRGGNDDGHAGRDRHEGGGSGGLDRQLTAAERLRV
jgi:hypothetical protein